MSLTTAALKVHAAAQSGVLESVEQPLSELNALLNAELPPGEVSSAQLILDEARRAAYAHRAQIVRTLQQLERSSVYLVAPPESAASWEMSG